MTKKRIILIITAVVAIIVGITLFFYFMSDLKTPPVEIQSGQQTQQDINTQSLTRSEAPKDVKVPEAGENVAVDVAIPVSVSKAAPGVSAKLRVFNISAQNDLYSPSTVIIKAGDTVHINFTAVDKTYDITFPDYGMKQIVNKGQTKVLEFQAVTTGKFTYYCALCGGLGSKAIGYVIVAP